MNSPSIEEQSPPKHDQRNGLPPQIPGNQHQIPLNLQKALPKLNKDQKNFPNVDSNFIFQSGNLPNSSTDMCSNMSFAKTNSSEITLKHLKNESGFIRDNGSIAQFNTKQKAAQEQQYPPEIDIDSYFEDFYRREIEVSQSATKEECMSTVEPFSIENYAASNFRIQPDVIILNKQGIKKLTTFSEKPLYYPLLKKVPLKKKAIVKKLASYILIYIGVFHDPIQDMYYKNKKDEQMRSLLLAIVFMLHNDESLINECYMQIMKAMRDIPTEKSLDLCWNLFLTVSSLFNVVDWRVQNVVRWFLINRMFSDDKYGQLARYSFIRFHDRLVFSRSFDIRTTKTEILAIPDGVQNGKKTFRCSLYVQMWNQRKRYPKLPIPMALYLIIKNLIKNGAALTKKPFPYLRTLLLFTKFKNANLQSSSIENINVDGYVKENEEEEEEANEDEDEMKLDDIIKASNQMFNENESHTTTAEEEDHVDDIEFESMDESWDETENSENRPPVKNCDLRLLKKWSEALYDNEEVIADGEVEDLMGLLLTWLLNLVDPIVPKSMSKYFIDTFDNESPKSKDYKDFVDNLPLLHKNTLKYIVGFLREISKNQNLTRESNETIAESLGAYFVSTTFATVDPFTRKKMIAIAPRFLLYCLDNIDVTDVYPLNPAYLVRNEE